MNERIRAREIRLIDAEGNQVGIVTRDEALRLAKDAELDLVEVSGPGVDVPVCRIMDYGKHKFKQSKAKKKQKQVQLKEIKFRPTTEKEDYRVKKEKIIAFLEEGNKVKVTLRFRGREMTHQQLGAELMTRLQEDLTQYAVIDQPPRLEGRQMVMMLSPQKKK